MGKIYYTKDINGNIVETEIRDERGERVKELEEENKKLNEENKELRKWIKEHVDYQTQADFRKRFEHN